MKENKSVYHLRLPVICLIFLILPVITFGQVVLKAFVSNNSVTINDQFSYSVEVSGNSGSLPDIELPDFKDFYIVGGPSQSSNVQYVNGKVSASKTYTYFLKPREVGTFTIDVASVLVDDKLTTSNEVTINVTKGGTAPSGEKSGSNESAVSSSDIYLKSTVTKINAYLGEQLIVEYKLYFKNQVRTYEVVENPSATGFWKEDFELPSQPLISKEVINGINYSVATLKRMAIFPTRVGKLEIEPMVINVEVIIPNQRRNQRSLFDAFFEPSGRSIKQTVKSNYTKLNISPLPEKDKPAGFAGAVGNFNLSLNVDKTEVNVNEAVSLKMRLSGTGNIKLAELPLVEIPGDIEQYDPKVSSNINKNENLINGNKNSEFILIPRLPGKYRIKPVHFSYFDPALKRYVTKSTIPVNLTVSGEATASGSAPMAGYSRKEVTLLGQDIRFIKENTELKDISDRNYFSGFLISGFLLGFALFSGFIIYDDRQLKLAGNKVLAKSRNAGKLAGKLLAEAKTHLKNRNFEAFYKSISTALSRFVQDKLNIELTDFNLQLAKDMLLKKNVPQNLVTEYLDVIQECDFKQFASGQRRNNEMEPFMERAGILINNLEKYI
jgi:hypothetical protein